MQTLISSIYTEKSVLKDKTFTTVLVWRLTVLFSGVFIVYYPHLYIFFQVKSHTVKQYLLNLEGESHYSRNMVCCIYVSGLLS